MAAGKDTRTYVERAFYTLAVNLRADDVNRFERDYIVWMFRLLRNAAPDP